MDRLLIFPEELLYNTVSQHTAVINNSVSCLDRAYIKINLLNKEETQ